MDKKVEKVLAESTTSAMERAENLCLERFEALDLKCESPIESLIAAAMPGVMLVEVEYGVPIVYQHRPFAFGEEPMAGYDYVAVYSQAQVASYRADFLFDVCFRNERSFLVVECDGHDFHERTKDQAERDRSRDRWMMSQGIQVMRFTGREIVRDPSECVEQIHMQLVRLLDQALGI